jgi:hypothetical protein
MKTSNILTLKLGFKILFLFFLMSIISCQPDEIGEKTNRTKIKWSCSDCSIAGSDIDENFDNASKAFLKTLINNSDIKTLLQSRISATGLLGGFTITGDYAINETRSALSKSLPDTLFSKLDSLNLPLFDSCMLRTFKNSSLPICCREFFIRIPDYDNQDKTKPIIVFPIKQGLIANKPQDAVFGYFLDANGDIDSITQELFDLDDKEDDFFQWYIGAYSDCDADWKEPGCDNDGVCEPMFGENASNCEDCQNLANKGPQTGSLYLYEVESLTDLKLRPGSNPATPAKRFQEWHYNFEYSLGFQYAIFDVNNNTIDPEFQFVIDDTDVDTPYRHKADIIKSWSQWGNGCEIKRTKEKIGGSQVSNNGVHTTQNWGVGGIMENDVANEMSSNFNPSSDEVYFVLYEKDWEFANPENIGYKFGVYINRGPGQNKRMEYTNNEDASLISIQTTDSDVPDLNPKHQVRFINNSPTEWTPIGMINGKPAYEWESTLDGEWRIKFVYIEH